MTPAIKAAEAAGIGYHIHRYVHDPGGDSYGLEAAHKLAIPPGRVFKTLVVTVDGGGLAVAVVPVSARLALKQAARAAGGRKAAMAEPAAVERATGYVLGGVSPLGQKRRLPVFIDASAQSFPTIFVSAGRRGLEIELAPADLAALTGGVFASLTAAG